MQRTVSHRARGSQAASRSPARLGGLVGPLDELETLSARLTDEAWKYEESCREDILFITRGLKLQRGNTRRHYALHQLNADVAQRPPPCTEN
jgi:hypothetical protein